MSARLPLTGEKSFLFQTNLCTIVVSGEFPMEAIAVSSSGMHGLCNHIKRFKVSVSCLESPDIIRLDVRFGKIVDM